MYSVDGGESSLGIDSEYVVYLDANGYAIYVEETEYNTDMNFVWNGCGKK